jgi:hypothetical protein
MLSTHAECFGNVMRVMVADFSVFRTARGGMRRAGDAKCKLGTQQSTEALGLLKAA